MKLKSLSPPLAHAAYCMNS